MEINELQERAKQLRAEAQDHSLHAIMASCNFYINNFNQDCWDNDAFVSFVEAARQAKLLLDKTESDSE